MITESLILRAEKAILRKPKSGIASMVTMEEWPKGIGTIPTNVICTEAKPSSSSPVGCTIREYRLEHTALESAYITQDNLEYVVDAIEANVERLWLNKFETGILRYVTDWRVVSYSYIREFPSGTVPLVLSQPRVSLFGRSVNRFKVRGGRCELNLKYDRCPAQILAFHPDAVHFLFPNLDQWRGEVVYREIDGHKFFRVVCTVAAKPVMPQLSRVYTILPRGLRGLVYRVVWKLLRINGKPQ